MGLFGEDDERAVVHASPKYKVRRRTRPVARPRPRPRAAGARVNGSNGSIVAVRPPRARDGAVDEERADRLRHLRVEDPRAGAPRAGSGCGARGRAAPRPRWAGSAPAPACRGRGAARRAGRAARCRPRRSNRRSRVERRLDVARRQPGPVGDVGLGRGPVAGQVARDEVSSAASGRLGGPTHVLGEPVEIGAAALPRARRRHPHEVEPHADAVRGGLADQRLDLGALQRAVPQRVAQPLGGLGRRRAAS